MALTNNANVKRLALLLWVLVAFFYFYLSYDFVRVTNNDRAFADYLHYVVQRAGAEGRSPREIRELLLVKAEQLSVPLRGEQILVKGSAYTLNIGVNYDVDVEIPVLQHLVYTKTFEHKVRYIPPR
jgi:hypothetical protein